MAGNPVRGVPHRLRVVQGRAHTEAPAENQAASTREPDSTIASLVAIVIAILLIAWVWWK